jgi:hypothetical protein
MLWAAPTERSFKSKAATDMVTAIWDAAVVVIITDGVEAEGIITAGGIIATDFNLKEAAAVGGLFHVSLGIRPRSPHHAELPDPQGAPALLHCVAQGKADRRDVRLVRKRSPSRMLMTWLRFAKMH